MANSQKKAERVSAACKESLKIKLEEEAIRTQSVMRERRKITAIAESHDVSYRHVCNIIEGTRNGHYYGVDK